MSNCNICNNSDQKIFRSTVSLGFESKYDLVECTNCKAIYFDVMPTDEELSKFYSGSYFNFNRWHDEVKGYFYAKKLNKITSEGNFLDIGSALGYFIHGIRQNSNWNVYGVEFGEDAVKFAQTNLGLDVKQGEIQNAGFPDKFFDYIHINNVLEHVRDPNGFMTECKRIIKDDGYLFLSVPNGYNDSRNLIRFFEEENKPARSKSGHLYFFQKQTYLKLFEETGFKIQKAKTNGIKRGLRNIEVLPKKKNWKNDYYPQTPSKKKEINIDEEKKHPDIYYKFRYIQTRLYDIPGLHKFGLDFLFLLRPFSLK